MKIKLFVICLYLFARASGCDPDKVQPAIPDIYTPEEAKMKLQKWEEGKKSYKKNCGSCHGISSKGKDSVPNFSEVQISLYQIAFVRRDEKNHAVAQGLSSDEFSNIIYFITHIKRDPAVIKTQ